MTNITISYEGYQVQQQGCHFLRWPNSPAVVIFGQFDLKFSEGVYSTPNFWGGHSNVLGHKVNISNVQKML